MKIITHDGSAARSVLLGMATDDALLSRIAPQWKPPGLFASEWENIVGTIIVDYHRKYRKAPRERLVPVFRSWAETKRDKKTVSLIEVFLASLTDEPEHPTDWLIDAAGALFHQVSMTRLAEGMSNHLEAGAVAKADELLANHSRINLGVGSGEELLDEDGMIESVLAARASENLISYPDALGNFFSGILNRDCLVAFTAPIKAGKTWWLVDIAHRGIEQGRKVAFFEVGDLTRTQIMGRMLCRIAQWPILSKSGWPLTLQWPTELDPPRAANLPAQSRCEPRTFDAPLGPKRAKRCSAILKGHRLRFSTHANFSINVDGIKAILDGWIAGGWHPDVVCLDYADVLSTPAGGAKMEARDQVNMTWKHLRRLSQELHCLVVTATQSNAAGFDAKTLSKKHFSEDNRKLAHVSAMIGINQSVEEKRNGVSRLNMIAAREVDYDPSSHCHVAGCLGAGCPAILSTF